MALRASLLEPRRPPQPRAVRDRGPRGLPAPQRHHRLHVHRAHAERGEPRVRGLQPGLRPLGRAGPGLFRDGGRGGGGGGGPGHRDRHPPAPGHPGRGRLQPHEVVAMFEDRILNVVPFMILLLPLDGFVVLALLGDVRKGKDETAAGVMACTTVLLAFVLSAWAVVRLEGLVGGSAGLRLSQPFLGFEWIDAGGFRVPLNLRLDPLSSVMILVVTGVGFLIHAYSLGYMAHDEDQVRYFSYLNLFTFFMLLLVLGGSLPLMFVGWEGVGLCSYLLIGFWFRRKSATDAGMKAFIVNRVGDVGLLLGMILAFHAFGSLDLVTIADNAGALAPEAGGEFGAVTLVCLLLFVGACGKSAQIPLHVWLPDAMEGPTPVSALIHAATMVTAGVYLVARLPPLFHLSAGALAVVAVVGGGTPAMSAPGARVQTDIKRVLAYSTVSQLGYMFLACGVGAFGVAIFHLFTHAFFKALLFLGAGCVIHALSGEQDMRSMGGLRRKIPWTFWTFVVGSLAIAGIPPLAGFFSKDEILRGPLQAGNTGLFALRFLPPLPTPSLLPPPPSPTSFRISRPLPRA